MSTLPAVSEPVFPLSLGSAPRPAIRPPLLAPPPSHLPVHVLGNRAFLRAWAARRTLRTIAAGGVTPGRETRPLAT